MIGARVESAPCRGTIIPWDGLLESFADDALKSEFVDAIAQAAAGGSEHAAQMLREYEAGATRYVNIRGAWYAFTKDGAFFRRWRA